MLCKYAMRRVLLASLGALLLALLTPPIEAKTVVNPAIKHSQWQRTEIMDGNGLFVMEWEIDNNNKDILITITANTRGYVGIGFSHKTGRMANADLILAWIDDRTGKANILDCHGAREGNAAPIQDDTQNCIIEEGVQNATHTRIKFRRPLETCDPHDVSIGRDTIKVLWSYGDKDPRGDLRGHGRNRGVKTMNLLEPNFKKSVGNPSAQWDVNMRNVTIDASMDTLYWCKIFALPSELTHAKHHIIGYEPLLTKEHSTKLPLVHHMSLYECSQLSYPRSDSASWDVWVKSNGAICNTGLLTPRDWDSCITLVATWGAGGNGQFLPDHIGIPIGGTTGAKYYMLEIHYDNPKAKRVLDHSGFRIHYSRNLRPNDAGMMITGVSVSDTQMIPPGQKSYRNVGICGPSCSSVVFPDTGINLVSVTLHSHVAGKKMKLRHIRDGREMERIVEDDNYDHNFQHIRQLENETNILPGDYLITDCSFETLGRKRPTFGGYSTKQEMCLSFITYYPKTDLAGCYSMVPVKEFFETFGVYQFYSLNMTDVENLFLYNENILDLLPTTVFPNFPPGGSIDDENNRIAIEALKNAKEYSYVDQEDALLNKSILNKLVISDPVEFHDRSFLSHLNQLPWSEPLFTRRVEHAMLHGKHMTFCRVSNESITIAAEIFRYPNFSTWIKPPSHCPYQLFIDSNSASSANCFTINLLVLLKSLVVAFTLVYVNPITICARL